MAKNSNSNDGSMPEPREDRTGEEMLKLFEQQVKVDPQKFNNITGVTSRWTPKRLLELWCFQEDQAEQNEIAEDMGVHPSTICRKIKAVDWYRFHREMNLLLEVDHDKAVEIAAQAAKEKAVNQFNAKQWKKQVTVEAKLQNLEERIVKLATEQPRQVLPSFNIKKAGKALSGTPEHMVLLLSDLHVGQTFTSYDTGISDYNPEIFVKRMANLREAMFEIYALHSKLYTIPELHVLGLGDFVQGGNMMGDWGCAYNGTMDVVEQAEVAASATIELMQAWEPLFKKINFYGVVGNHGRAGVAKNTEKVSSNFDNVAYALIEGRLKNRANFSVKRTRSWWQQFNANGVQVLGIHGDNVTANAIRVEGTKMQEVLAPSNLPRFDVLCMGHFHSHLETETTAGAKILVNGSFVGGDVYSLHKLRCASRPTQTLFGTHPEVGMTWKYVLDLDRPRALANAA